VALNANRPPILGERGMKKMKGAKNVNENQVIPKSEWKWFGNAGHFICADFCRFHLCTQVGDYLISSVGQYVPDAGVREINAQVRGVELEGRGDARLRDYMNKFGFEEIGCDRLFETMVFKVSGKTCQLPDCNCGMPEIVPSELDGRSYNDAGSATRGHMELCEKWAAGGAGGAS
jgi:hypothetical protein